MKGCSKGRWRHRSGEHHGDFAVYGPVVQLGVHAALSRRRSRVQIPSGPPPGPIGQEDDCAWSPGRVAQLVERAPEKREVTGSTPVPTTLTVQFRGTFLEPQNSRVEISWWLAYGFGDCLDGPSPYSAGVCSHCSLCSG